MTRLNILSLHRMGPPWARREAVHELEHMLPTYAPEHYCLVHDAALPVPEHVKQIKFHAIVLGPTFLCDRYSPRRLRQTLQSYDWVRRTDAIKIALPQDDYDCAAILDRWMVDWNVDLVYTVCPERWDVLYPTYSRSGKIALGYTGYVSERWLAERSHPREHADRSIDVSYRARKLPANFGSVGNLKSEIGERFLKAVPPGALKCDISTDPRHTLPGSKWHAFLEDSKFCLTTPSGSSLLDPEGAFRERVIRYTNAHPQAEFDEIAEHCFPGEDRKHVFTAISPRNIEAAIAGTVQLATPGMYSGFMKPYEHYIPLEEDCSNIATVLEIMRDKPRVASIATRCRDAVLNAPQLRYPNHVGSLIEFIQGTAAGRGTAGTTPAEMEVHRRRYEAAITAVAARYWRRQRITGLLRAAAIQLGARRIKRLLVTALTG